jgi:hypothetical protein
MEPTMVLDCDLHDLLQHDFQSRGVLVYHSNQSAAAEAFAACRFLIFAGPASLSMTTLAV